GGGHPPEQQEHHPGGGAGRRPHRSERARGADPGQRRGVRGPHELRPAAGADANAKEMTALASNVLAGEVTRAVRDSISDVGPITEGDYLGITSDGILAVEQTQAAAACRLLDLLVTDEHEIVTVIEGEGSTPADTRAITEWLDEHHPGALIAVHHGGQPLYPYLFGIE